MNLRDPVHGLITFENVAHDVVHALIDTAEVQRLRGVRQLGLASLVFPGAEHSRFSHAVGAAHVMNRLLERVRSMSNSLPRDQQLTEQSTADGIAAAMLHDIGHGPFSHLFEDVLPHTKSHEDWTQDIVLSPLTDVNRALESTSTGMATRVAALLRGQYPLTYLCRAVSGALDVDRADYLLRDSHMTGVRYGIYDLDWVMHALRIAEVGGSWVLAVDGAKGLPPVESFFLGRHFMFQQVYHHKATRAAEALVRSIFTRVAELVRENRGPDPLPKAFSSAATATPLTLDEYLSMNDAELLHCIAAWAHGSDELLMSLCSDLLRRRLPKSYAMPSLSEAQSQEVYQEVCALAGAHGWRPGLHVQLDFARDVPFFEPDHPSADGLWVVGRGSEPGMQRLGDASFVLRELRNKQIRTPRLLFPAEFRNEVVTAVDAAIARYGSAASL